MEIENYCHEADQAQVEGEANQRVGEQLEGAADPGIAIYKDWESITMHMNYVASEEGTRKGKLLMDDKEFPRGGSRIVKKCVNKECKFRMMARKQNGGYIVDKEWSDTLHYTLSDDGMRGVCSIRAKATVVRGSLYPY
jgi:hypothetical protein